MPGVVIEIVQSTHNGFTGWQYRCVDCKESVTLERQHECDKKNFYRDCEISRRWELKHLIIQDVISKVLEILKNENVKTPHKCPICDGKGKVISENFRVNPCGGVPIIYEIDCHACDKGVLWR